MVGTRDDPGLMVLSLHRIFDLIQRDKSSDEFEVTCSYLEVYNEVCCGYSLKSFYVTVLIFLSLDIFNLFFG